MARRTFKPGALPSPEQMAALVRAAKRLHGLSPSQRQDALLRQAITLLGAHAATAQTAAFARALAADGRPLTPGPTPAALLNQSRGLGRHVTFTSVALEAAGFPVRRPRGVREAVYSVAPPPAGAGNERHGSVLAAYFNHPLTDESRASAARDLRLLHSTAASLMATAKAGESA